MAECTVFNTWRSEVVLSRSQAAELLGVSRHAVGQWDRGDTFPTKEKWAKIAEVYGVSVDQIEQAKEGHHDGRSKKKGSWKLSSCKACDHLAACRVRVDLGCYVLCETPIAEDRQIAKARGLG